MTSCHRHFENFTKMANSIPSSESNQIEVTPSILSNASPNVAGPNVEHRHSSIQGPLKRNRIQLSCTHCRARKLKCDRQSPCHQCIKKGRASQCSFPTSAPCRKPRVSLQNRLQHLESLVKDVMTGQTPSTPHINSVKENGNLEILPGSAKGRQVRSTGQPNIDNMSGQFPPDRSPVASGSVIQSRKETAYIGATHWAAILDDVNRQILPRLQGFDADYLPD